MTRGRYRIRCRLLVDGERVDREEIVDGARLDDMLRRELLMPGLVVRIHVDLMPDVPVSTDEWRT